jgi:hypothetical protein
LLAPSDLQIPNYSVNRRLHFQRKYQEISVQL